MDNIEQLLAQQMEQSRAAEAQRKAMMEEQLMRELEVASQDPAVDLSALAALTPGNTPLVQAMSQQAARQSNIEQGGQQRVDDLFDALVGNTGSAAEKKLLSGMGQERKQEAIGERFQESQMRGLFKDIKKDFSKERGSLDEITRQFDGMESALLSGDYERIKGQLSNFALLL